MRIVPSSEVEHAAIASTERRRTAYRYVRRRWHVLFRVIDAVGWAVVRALGVLGRKILAGTSPPDPESVRRILLVQLDHLGDAVISTAMLAPLQQHFHHASIEILCGPRGAEVFRSAREVDRLHVSQVNRFHRAAHGLWIAAVFYWGLALRQRRYDVAIDVRGELPHSLLIWLTGAKYRVGWDAGGGGFLLTASPRYVANRPELDSRAALLGAVGVPAEPASQLPRFAPHVAAQNSIVARLCCADVDARRPLVVAHIGAGTSAKAWPAAHWRTLVPMLSDVAAVVLVGSANERPISHAIAGILPSDNIINWVGELSLAETAALCQRASLVIGADSGPAHLAAAVGAPLVVLFSGTNDSRQWRPRGVAPVVVLQHPVSCAPCHQSACPLADHPCLRGIAPDQVYAAAMSLLRPRRIGETTHPHWTEVAAA